MKQSHLTYLIGFLFISILLSSVVKSHDINEDEDIDEQKKEEKPLPILKTVDQCKGDCTIDWQDCVTMCGNDGPQKCYVTCQTKVKKCLDECPNVICHDHCSIELEKCQRKEKRQENCESPYLNCQEECDNAYIGRVDL